MDRVTGQRLVGLVEHCAELMEGLGDKLEGTSEQSLALYRLHAAAVLSAAVGRIVGPVWAAIPELQRDDGMRSLDVFRMTPETSQAVLAFFTDVRKSMNEARSVVETAIPESGERNFYLDGISEVLRYVDDAVDVMSRQASSTVRRE